VKRTIYELPYYAVLLYIHFMSHVHFCTVTRFWKGWHSWMRSS